MRPGFRSTALVLLLSLAAPAAAEDTAPEPLVVAARTAPTAPAPEAGFFHIALNRFADTPSPGLFPLHWAALQDRADVVRRLIERGKDPDGRDAQGHTPLMTAAAFGNAGAAEVLLALGADPIARDTALGDTPLHYAARAGQTEVVRLLLAKGVDANVGASMTDARPLHYAAAFGHRRAIELLLAGGADPNAGDNHGVMPQQYASRRNRPDIVDFLRSLGARDDNLFDAVSAYDVVRFNALLAGGADVNEQGLNGTAAHLAAAKGHVWLLRNLIDAGADLELRGEPAGGRPLHAAVHGNQAEAAALLAARGANVNARDDWGRTPLIVAAAFGNVVVAEALLVAGADPQARDAAYGDTAIHVAAAFGHVQLVELLLNGGIDVNVRGGRHGAAPLHYAAHWAQVGMIEFLLAHGADLNLPDNSGATPLVYAAAKSLLGPSARDLLMERGAHE